MFGNDPDLLSSTEGIATALQMLRNQSTMDFDKTALRPTAAKQQMRACLRLLLRRRPRRPDHVGEALPSLHPLPLWVII